MGRVFLIGNVRRLNGFQDPSRSKGHSLLLNVLGPFQAWSLHRGHAFSQIAVNETVNTAFEKSGAS